MIQEQTTLLRSIEEDLQRTFFIGVDVSKNKDSMVEDPVSIMS